MPNDPIVENMPLDAVLAKRAQILAEERRLCETIPSLREAAAVEAIRGEKTSALASLMQSAERLAEVRELIAGLAVVARATEIREQEALIAEIQGASAAVQAEIDLVDNWLAALVEESLKSEAPEYRDVSRDLHRARIKLAFVSGKLPKQDLEALAKYNADHVTQARYRSRLDVENLRLANLRSPDEAVTAEKLLERNERAVHALPAESAA